MAGEVGKVPSKEKAVTLSRFFFPKIQLLLYHLVALTTGFFQCLTIDNRDMTAVVADQSSPLQNFSGHRHTRTSSPKHLREKLLSQWQNISANTVVAHQKPPRQPLFNSMKPIAGSDLCNFHG